MNKKTVIIIASVLVAFLAIVGLAFWQNAMTKKKVDYSQYNTGAVIQGDDSNGNIADHVMGNKDAKVLLVEYSDFQCPYCAKQETIVKKLLDKYGDKIGVIRRTYIIPGHKNARPAAEAAEAAGLQGYWEAYANLLFSNQNVWSSLSSASDRQSQFEEYFTKVSGGKGDLDKFRSDLSSRQVSDKIDFDVALEGDKVQYTPLFMLDGKILDYANSDSVSEDQSVKNPQKKELFDFISGLIDTKLAEKK